ncbi:hypothetical protein [Paenibacillus sp. UMB4589-SE434]|uniref:hypothetical protein n=1 Tax=Paenibacillus sp. UMB4589-SE434 TaxID=3046314 RepID=UPI0025504CD8|nr:hypothetical protein [Paenibacillus sp. UMB4589-SE434]MDK8181538.1 hypothetical protein [Paenibacillus sp. UMB4589-SE434]
MRLTLQLPSGLQLAHVRKPLAEQATVLPLDHADLTIKPKLVAYSAKPRYGPRRQAIRYVSALPFLGRSITRTASPCCKA